MFILQVLFLKEKYYQIKSIKCFPLTHICDLRCNMGDLSVLMRTKVHFNLKKTFLGLEFLNLTIFDQKVCFKTFLKGKNYKNPKHKS